MNIFMDYFITNSYNKLSAPRSTRRKDLNGVIIFMGG